uniref:Uncharacterized protein n=1 Tax=Oryza rufipogon TaxID=4529 RepID=A0A0E0NCV5_ORYRU
MTRDVSHGRALVHGGHNNQQRGSAGTGEGRQTNKTQQTRDTQANTRRQTSTSEVSLRKPYPVPAEADDGDLAPSLILV